MKKRETRQIDVCPVRGCGAWLPGVESSEHDGAQADCNGPRRHRLTFETDGNWWRWRNDGPTPQKIIESQDSARAARLARLPRAT